MFRTFKYHYLYYVTTIREQFEIQPRLPSQYFKSSYNSYYFLLMDVINGTSTFQLCHHDKKQTVVNRIIYLSPLAMYNAFHELEMLITRHSHKVQVLSHSPEYLGDTEIDLTTTFKGVLKIFLVKQELFTDNIRDRPHCFQNELGSFLLSQ